MGSSVDIVDRAMAILEEEVRAWMDQKRVQRPGLSDTYPPERAEPKGES
jgi:hypothetical protein